ncbi:MAG TPA: energy transducer TonB, partial [Polyangia bacterium]|nr:energy transducer TonB [Polyangia bacterium]
REPLTELRRLYKLARAYERANQGDALTAKKDLKAAATAYIDASKLAPENDELMFWAALSQAAAGKIDEAATQMMKVFDLHPGWRALLPYLRSSDSPGAPILQIRLGIPPKPRPGEGKRPPAAAPAPASPGAHEEKPPPPPAPPAAPAPPAPPPPQEPRTITSQQAAAMKISGVVPDYTEAARRANVTGEVLAKICVSESGTVTGVTLLKDLPQLGKHVQDTVRSWRYRPLQEGGRAVPFCHVTRFVFQLD